MGFTNLNFLLCNHTITQSHKFNKPILFYLLGLLIFLGSCSETDKVDHEKYKENDVEVRGSHNCDVSEEIPYGNGNFVCGPFSTTFTTSFADYPGCTFTIGIIGSDCVNIPTGNTVFYLEGMSLNSHNCPAYNMDVQAAASNGTLADFSKNFERKMYDATLEYLAQTLTQAWTTFIVDYRPTACVKYCYDSEKVNGTNFEILVLNVTDCGTGCCKYTTTAYYSGSAGEIVYHTDIETIDFSDCEDLIPGAICKDARYRTPCTFRCE